ncbi:MAG: hypothetical protein QM296_09805 [Bacillota bacterium]|nr:hypothetical protein [Bacillota bacterium]
MSTDGQKLRWCPQIGAGTKKLTRGGQKMRWCPQIGAGTKKLSTPGKKSRLYPRNRAQTPISAHGWSKKALSSLLVLYAFLRHTLFSDRCTRVFRISG